MNSTFIAISGSLLLAGGAQAQEARPAQGHDMKQVSDDEVARFALVALVVNQVMNDKALDQGQRNTAISQSLRRNKLASRRFSEIEHASQTDAALQQRIRVAAQAHIKAVREHQR